MIAFLAIFVPIEKTLATVAGLVFADLILGIIVAIRAKQPITSSGLKRTILKIFIFEAALCFGFLAQTYIPGSIPYVNLIGGFISLTETTSIIENLNLISGGSMLAALVSKINVNQE